MSRPAYINWGTRRFTQPTVAAEYFVTALSTLCARGLRAPPTRQERGHILQLDMWEGHKQPVKALHVNIWIWNRVAHRSLILFVLQRTMLRSSLQLSPYWTCRVGITPDTRWWWTARSMTSTFSRVESSTLKAHPWLVSGLIPPSMKRKRGRHSCSPLVILLLLTQETGWSYIYLACLRKEIKMKRKVFIKTNAWQIENWVFLQWDGFFSPSHRAKRLGQKADCVRQSSPW